LREFQPKKILTERQREENIRQSLLEARLEIKNGYIGRFAEYFVKHSQGNDTVTEVVLFLNEDFHHDYKLLGSLEEGFGNIGALRVLTIRFLLLGDPSCDNGKNCLD
jgi:hypothetical protein